jgi:hypothetical protein
VDNDNSASVTPLRQNGRVPAVRVNTVTIKADTAGKVAPVNIKDLPTGAQIKLNGKEAEKLSVLPEKEPNNTTGVKASGGALLHRTTTASLGRYNTY